VVSDVSDIGAPQRCETPSHRPDRRERHAPLAELRRDKRRLELEVEILKRAAAYFARENVLPN
jgi:transposase